MTGVDRIAEPWGARTPYGPGEAWPIRVDTLPGRGLAPERRGPVGAVRVDPALQRRRTGHRRQGRADRRRPGPRGRPGQPRPAGSQGPVRLAGQQLAGPADPRRWSGADGKLVETDWDTAMDRVVARSDELLEEQGPGAIGFYTTGQLFLEEYYTLGVIAHGGIGTNAHGRQHPAVHRHRGRGAEGVASAADGQPGSYTDVDHADVIALYGPQHGRDADGAVDADAGPARRARTRRRCSASTPARHRSPEQATVHLAPAAGHQRGADERAAARDHRARLGRPASTSRHTRSASRSCARVLDGYTAGAGRRDLRRPAPRTCARRRRAHRHRRAAAVDGAAGLLPVPPGHRRRRAGQQPAPACAACSASPAAGILQMNGQPTAQNTREMRRRRRPARLPQLGQPRRTSRELARAVERRPDADPALRPRPPTRCRSSATPSRARSGCCGSAATNPAVSLPELRADPPDPGAGPAVPGRAGHLPDRDRRAGRRGAARRDVGREDRDLHQRRPHRAPVREGGRAARARPGRTWTSSSTTPAGWTSATRTASRWSSWHDARGGVRGVEGVHPRAALRLHRHQLRQAARRQRHPVALQRRAPRRHRAALHRRRSSGRTRTTARPTARTWSPARRVDPDRVPGPEPGGQGGPQGRRVPAAARGARPTSTPAS